MCQTVCSARAEPLVTMLLSLNLVYWERHKLVNYKVGAEVYVHPKCFEKLGDLILSARGEISRRR